MRYFDENRRRVTKNSFNIGELKTAGPDASSIRIDSSAGTGTERIAIKGKTEKYIPIEYIESTGEQYINTGVCVTQETGINIEFLSNNTLSSSADEYGCILGARQGSAKQEFQLTTYIEEDAFGGTVGWGSTRYDAGIVVGEKTSVSLLARDYTNSSGVKTTFSNITLLTPVHLTLFALNNNGTISQHGKLRLYSAQLYYRAHLIRDYIPCIRASDGEPGLFDRVDKRFYRNAGAGFFITGPRLGVKSILVNSGDSGLNLSITGSNLFSSLSPLFCGAVSLVGHSPTHITLADGRQNGGTYNSGTFIIPNWRKLQGRTVRLSAHYSTEVDTLRPAIRIQGFRTSGLAIGNTSGIHKDGAIGELEGDLSVSGTLDKLPNDTPETALCVALYTNTTGTVKKGEKITYSNIMLQYADDEREFAEYINEGVNIPNEIALKNGDTLPIRLSLIDGDVTYSDSLEIGKSRVLYKKQIESFELKSSYEWGIASQNDSVTTFMTKLDVRAKISASPNMYYFGMGISNYPNLNVGWDRAEDDWGFLFAEEGDYLYVGVPISSGIDSLELFKYVLYDRETTGNTMCIQYVVDEQEYDITNTEVGGELINFLNKSLPREESGSIYAESNSGLDVSIEELQYYSAESGDTYPLTIKYLCEDGGECKSASVYMVRAGSTYTAVPPVISGYVTKCVPITRTITEGTTISFVYTKGEE